MNEVIVLVIFMIVVTIMTLVIAGVLMAFSKVREYKEKKFQQKHANLFKTKELAYNDYMACWEVCNKVIPPLEKQIENFETERIYLPAQILETKEKEIELIKQQLFELKSEYSEKLRITRKKLDRIENIINQTRKNEKKH